MLYCSIENFKLFDFEECLGKDLAIKTYRNGKFARITSRLENGLSLLGRIYFTNPHLRGEWLLKVRFVELLDYRHKQHFTLNLAAEELTELSQFGQKIELSDSRLSLGLLRKKTLFVDHGPMHPFMVH